MAGTPKRMSQVKQLLKMHSQGMGVKTVARNLGISKNTVKSYLNKINSEVAWSFRTNIFLFLILL